MPNQKRKQAVIKIAAVDLDAITAKKIEELGKTLKALMYEEPTNCCILLAHVALSDVKRAILKPEEVEDGALWYFWRMLTWYSRELWWGYTGWEAFGWWEGENPFKDWWATDDFDHGDIMYLKSLDGKGEEKTYSEPQGERAFFIVKDLEKALDALEKTYTTFALAYEDGAVKLMAANEGDPDDGACLMIKYDWKDWCDNYYKDYSDFGEKLLEYTYGINTPDPEFKDGKLVFGDQFEKTPEEFVYDLATLEPPVD